MNPLKQFFRLMGVVFALLSATILADTATITSPGNGSMSCPNAANDVYGSGLISRFCWTCFFPMRVAGVATNKPINGDFPDGSATSQLLCACNDSLGVPRIGTQSSFWAPARIIEVVRKPGCVPSMGGATIGGTDMLLGGSKTTEHDTNDKSFYHYNYYSFPLYIMLDLLTAPECNSGGYSDFDLIASSFYDPVWNEDELNLFQTPEIVVFSNPIAIAACGGECLAISGDLSDANAVPQSPTLNMFWCAGCWGHLPPFTGNLNVKGSPPRDSSLIATRALATMHRRGLAHKTFGNGEMCGGSIAPMLPKSQYKMSMIYPVAEASGRCCHWVGESTFKWGEWRNIPGTGEDFIYMLWRFTDCCVH